MELILNDNNEVNFEFSVEGSNTNIKDIRLLFEFPQCNMSFKGEYKDGRVGFAIPNLSNFIQEGSYKYKMEVIIDEHYYIPVDGSAMFKKPVQFTSKLVSDKKASKAVKFESKEIDATKTVIEEKKEIIEKKPAETPEAFMTRIKAILK
jgi:hypothetical protein